MSNFPKYTKIDGGYTLKTAKQGVVEITTPLPDEVESLTHEEWGERASSNDMAVRKEATNVLRYPLEYPPGTYVLWTKPEQATVIYLHQLIRDEAGGGAEEEEEEAPPTTSKKGASASAKAKAAAKVKEAKAKAAAAKAAKTSKGKGKGPADPAPSEDISNVLDVLEDIRAIAEENRELNQQLHAKMATVNVMLQVVLTAHDMLDSLPELKEGLGLEELSLEDPSGN